MGFSGQDGEQSMESWPPAATRDSSVRSTNHARTGYDGKGHLYAWPSSLSRLQHASEDCVHSNSHSSHAEPPAMAEPWQQSGTAFPHDHQFSSPSHHRSTVRAPKALFPIRKHGKGKERSLKTHTCFCGRAFNKREHLKRHNLLVHEEIRPFSCEGCDLHFGTKQNFQVHLSTRKHRQRVLLQQPATRSTSAEAVGILREEGIGGVSPVSRDLSASQ